MLNPSDSQEKVIVQGVSQDEHKFDKNQVKSVLSDFEQLDFEDNKCFDKIASSYREQGKVSLFDYVILNKRKEIINILDNKLSLEKQEVFRRGLVDIFFKLMKE